MIITLIVQFPNKNIAIVLAATIKLFKWKIIKINKYKLAWLSAQFTFPTSNHSEITIWILWKVRITLRWNRIDISSWKQRWKRNGMPRTTTCRRAFMPFFRPLKQIFVFGKQKKKKRFSPMSIFSSKLKDLPYSVERLVGLNLFGIKANGDCPSNS